MSGAHTGALRAVAPLEVGVVVADVDAMLAFYAGVLGMTVLSDLHVPADMSRKTGLAANGYRVVRLESDRGDRLKLATPAGGPDACAASAFAMQRRGACYLTFIVDDVRALHARLRTSGARIRSDGVVELRPGVWLVLATDPESNFVEFLQYDDLASYRPAKQVA
jgi:catechol 2,3-dioxygenase-like lactoylglutathione lyase family enzyme